MYASVLMKLRLVPTIMSANAPVVPWFKEMVFTSPRDYLVARMCCLELVLELAFICCFLPSFGGVNSTRTMHSISLVHLRHVNNINAVLLDGFEAMLMLSV